MILVVNLGLKSVRAIVFDGDGRKLASASKSVRSYLDGDCVEQDGHEWWQNTIAVIRQATVEPQVRNSIKGITVTSSACCLVCVDGNGKPLRRTIMVSDRRATTESEALLATPLFKQSHNGSSEICSKPGLMLPKLMWLQKNEEQTFGTARWYLSSNDFLILKLTGEVVTDPLNAEKFGYETGARRYPSELHRIAGVDGSRLPCVMPSGTNVGRVTKRALSAIGFPANSSVQCYLTTYDAICAFFGSGVTREGEACDISGTVTSMRTLRKSPLECAGSKIFSQHEELTGLHILGGSNNLGGGLVEWAKSSLFPDDPEPYDVMEREAARSGTGARGLFFLPYLMGERAPLWDSDARGVFFGCERHHDRADMVRAVFEGCAFSVALLKEAIEEHGCPISTVSVSGGLSRLREISQIKADVLNAEVRVPQEFETTAVGAYLLCSLSMGNVSSFDDFGEHVPVGETISPDADTSKSYREMLEFFKELYEGCTPLFKKRKKLLQRMPLIGNVGVGL